MNAKRQLMEDVIESLLLAQHDASVAKQEVAEEEEENTVAVHVPFVPEKYDAVPGRPHQARGKGSMGDGDDDGDEDVGIPRRPLSSPKERSPEGFLEFHGESTITELELPQDWSDPFFSSSVARDGTLDLLPILPTPLLP